MLPVEVVVTLAAQVEHAAVVPPALNLPVPQMVHAPLAQLPYPLAHTGESVMATWGFT